MVLADPQLADHQPTAQPTCKPRRALSERSTRRKGRLLENLVDPTVVPEDAETLNAQANDIYLAFKPRNGWQDWLTSEIAVIMVRINRCSRIERRLRDWAAYRAIEFWDDDQKLEVETLALKIHRQPGKTVLTLRGTPAGCDWLAARWRMLARVDVAKWTDEHRTLAGSLTGGDPSIDPTLPGFAAAMVGELTTQRERVVEADEIARGLVEADLTDDVPNLSRLRRYARSLHRQMKYYIDQFYVEHPDRWDDPNRKPAFIAQACIDRERERKQTWSFAEPAPDLTKTKPPTADPVEPLHPFDETKPFCPPIERASDQTKPLEPVGTLAAALEAAFQAEPGLVVEQQPKVVERKRRVDPVRDTNQRQKLARRREALAKLAGV